MIIPTTAATELLAQRGAFSLWPDSASTSAPQIDGVYVALLGLTLFFVLLLGAMALGFGVKYRAGSASLRDRVIRNPLLIEIVFIAAPLAMTVAIFAWGAYVFVRTGTPPAEARTIYVVGKQWMWKVQHPGGPQEINELHVPTGEPVKLVLTSSDVIHSFFVPAFRLKRDALPGQYTSMWFEATQPGVYHLFCAEYCGGDHARMRGRVVVMRPADFQRWLAAAPDPTGLPRPAPADEAAPQSQQAGTFERLGCAGCHGAKASAGAPSLAGLFGRTVRLRDGRSVVADEAYLRRAIVEPHAAVAAGAAAPSPMPNYAGQLSEAEIAALVEYIKSLSAPPAGESS